MNTKKHTHGTARPTVDQVKPLKPKLPDAEPMSFFLRPIALNERELSLVINSALDPIGAFNAWQFFNGRLALLEMGQDKSRN
jgi:hypothetical protein